VVVIGIVAAVMMRNRSAAVPPPPIESPTPVASSERSPSPTPSPDATASPTPTPTPATSPGASPVAGVPVAAASPSASATPKPTSTPAARGTATPTPSPTTGAAASAATAATAAGAAAKDDALATFSDIRLLSVNGKRTTDVDVVLNFSHGHLAVTPRSGGSPLASLPYEKIVHATFVRARSPKWAPAQAQKLAAPPDDLDVGGTLLLRTARSWLVLQGADSYSILRLDDSSAAKLLDTFEQRTGLKIDRQK
jgi:hypothetical protein